MRNVLELITLLPSSEAKLAMNDFLIYGNVYVEVELASPDFIGPTILIGGQTRVAKLRYVPISSVNI